MHAAVFSCEQTKRASAPCACTTTNLPTIPCLHFKDLKTGINKSQKLNFGQMRAGIISTGTATNFCWKTVSFECLLVFEQNDYYVIYFHHLIDRSGLDYTFSTRHLLVLPFQESQLCLTLFRPNSFESVNYCSKEINKIFFPK